MNKLTLYKKIILGVVILIFSLIGYNYYSNNYTYIGFVKKHGSFFINRINEGEEFFYKGYRNNYILLLQDRIIISEAKKVDDKLIEFYPSSVIKFEIKYFNPSFNKKDNTLTANTPLDNNSNSDKILIEILNDGNLKYNNLVYEPCDIKDIDFSS